MAEPISPPRGLTVVDRQRDLWQQLRTLCVSLERGQAQTPLLDYVDEQAARCAAPPAIAVLGIHAEDEAAVVTCLRPQYPRAFALSQVVDIGHEFELTRTILQAAAHTPVCVVVARAADAPGDYLSFATAIAAFGTVGLILTGATDADRERWHAIAKSRCWVSAPAHQPSETSAVQELSAPIEQLVANAGWCQVLILQAVDLVERALLQQSARQATTRHWLVAKHEVELDARAQVGQLNSSDYRYQRDTLANHLDSELRQRVQIRTIHASPAFNRLTSLLDDLNEGCLTEETSGRSVKLALRDESQRELLVAVQHQVRADLTEDHDWALAAAKQQFERQSALAALMPSDQFSQPLRRRSLEELADAVCRVVAFASRYHGELPRRTWFDRLVYGRRPVFAIMMVSSLAGTAWGTRSEFAAFLAPIMFALFLGGVTYTFRSFRQERIEFLARELMRLRETLTAELRRLYELAQAEWLNRMKSIWQETVSELDRAFEQQVTDSKRRQVEVRDLLQREQQAALRALDQRQRSLDDLRQELLRLRKNLPVTPNYRHQ